MCVIVVKPKGKSIDFETLQKCQLANPDMFGVSYSYKGFIYTYRGQTKLTRVWDRIITHIQTLESVDMVWHFRIATSGKVNTVNSHPFPLSRYVLTQTPNMKYFRSKHGVLVHNGIISGLGGKVYSDTMNLARLLTKLTQTERHIMLETVADYSNKFAILYPNRIELFGHFQNESDCHFSNLSWKYKQITTPSVSTTYVWESGKGLIPLTEHTTHSSVAVSFGQKTNIPCAICGDLLMSYELKHPFDSIQGKPVCDYCSRSNKNR